MPNSLTYILQKGQRLFTSGTCCGFWYVGRSPRRAVNSMPVSPGFSRALLSSTPPQDPKSGRGLLTDHYWPTRGPTSQLDAVPWSARVIKERRLRASWKLEEGDPQVRLLRVTAPDPPHLAAEKARHEWVAARARSGMLTGFPFPLNTPRDAPGCPRTPLRARLTRGHAPRG